MTKISPKTQEIVDALKQDDSQSIVACSYTWAFGRSGHVPAAFRIAREQGIIEQVGVGGMNNPIYRRVA